MIDRRTIMTAALAAIAGPASTRRVLAQAAMSRITAYAFSFPALAGGEIRLADYRRPSADGRQHRVAVRLHAAICRIAAVVDRVSRSRLDDRRRSLERFRRQEPGGAAEIAETAQHQYGVTFPIAAKTVVKGPNAHPFYKWAAEARPKDVPRWNFHKYLIGRGGIYRRRVPRNRRTDGYADQNRHRARARGHLTRSLPCHQPTGINRSG